jgi:ABC-type multidrug transport system ATPase subunit
MYSRLNLVINELNYIGINKLGDADSVRKIISLLPQQRNGSIITILHNLEDLSQMTPMIVVGKIAAFEMSRKMGQQEDPTSSNPYAFACDEHQKMKGKKKAPSQVKKRRKKKNKMMMIKMINPQHHPSRTKKQSDTSER